MIAILGISTIGIRVARYGSSTYSKRRIYVGTCIVIIPIHLSIGGMKIAAFWTISLSFMLTVSVDKMRKLQC